MRRVPAISFGAILLSACASKPPPATEPRDITLDVPRAVVEKCKDQRPTAAPYPDTDEKLAAIPDNDFEQLAKVFRVGRDRRDARLIVDDVQIKGCAGP